MLIQELHIKNKLNICFILIFFCMLNLSACGNDKGNLKRLQLMNIQIFPSSSSSIHYIIDIYDDGKFNIKYGELIVNDEGIAELAKPFFENEIILDSDKTNKISKSVVEIDNIGNYTTERIIKGGCKVFLNTKKSFINLYIKDIYEKKGVLLELFEFIKFISPIEIKIENAS